MGTNYYLREDVCEHCGRGRGDLHIGKSSAGWCFSLNTHPYDGILSLDDWQHAWSQPKTAIYDEYGRQVSPDEMLRVITKRDHPSGLRRHTVDGRHCIAHGEGTYDLLVGEFS